MDWKEHFEYDETSPSCLRWVRNAARNKVKKGDVAGIYKQKKRNPDRGYYMIYVDGISKAAHRIIWEIFNYSLTPSQQIDHINGITTDNRITNLRVVDNQTNCFNQTKRITNKSGVTGVHLTNNGNGRIYWVASWMHNGKRKGRMFSVSKYGNEVAFKSALHAREEAMEQLKLEGINISERHGK